MPRGAIIAGIKMVRGKTRAWLLMLAAATAGCSGTDAIDLSTAGAARVASQTSSPSSDAQALPPPGSAGTTAPTTTTLTDQSTVGAQTGQSVAAIARNARIQFAPVIGAAAETLEPLSSRLSARGRQRGLTISSEGQAATHVLKGYFSTINDEKGTTIIFVWDVLDPAGNRLHRIQGQEKASGTGEGWTAVNAANINAVADRTIDELAAWLQGTSTRT
uniref:Lipoprotein n=1 Tax=Chelativorans sp. (strain BNC1) TaxID=266779 RepID=Q11GC9_CHESB